LKIITSFVIAFVIDRPLKIAVTGGTTRQNIETPRPRSAVLTGRARSIGRTDAFTSFRVTYMSRSCAGVALTATKGRKAVISGKASVAVFSSNAWLTIALTVDFIANLRHRTREIAVTGLTSISRDYVPISRLTVTTVPSNYERFAFALTRQWVTFGPFRAIGVTLTGLTPLLREAVVAIHTLSAMQSEDSGTTRALTGHFIAVGRSGSNQITLTGDTILFYSSITRSASFASKTSEVGFALTLTCDWITLKTLRPLGITITRFAIFERSVSPMKRKAFVALPAPGVLNTPANSFGFKKTI
jgi:hypothetical protein